MAESVNLPVDTVEVKYLDCDENEKNWTTEKATAAVVTGSDISWNDGWYVVKDDVSVAIRVSFCAK